MPLTLDCNHNEFFTEDGRHFLCKTHGAVCEPISGLCIKGPCEGMVLFPLVIEEKSHGIFLMEP